MQGSGSKVRRSMYSISCSGGKTEIFLTASRRKVKIGIRTASSNQNLFPLKSSWMSDSEQEQREGLKTCWIGLWHVLALLGGPHDTTFVVHTLEVKVRTVAMMIYQFSNCYGSITMLLTSHRSINLVYSFSPLVRRIAWLKPLSHCQNHLVKPPKIQHAQHSIATHIHQRQPTR